MTLSGRFLIPCILFLFFGFLLFWRLGNTHLTNWDEAWHADVSRNMARTGNIIKPEWNKEPFFDKPPLYFWLSSAAYKLFGETEFSARFISALAAFGSGIIIFFLAKLLFDTRAAIISTIILASSIGFLYRARTGNLDALFTFWILFSIFCFYKAYGTKKKWWYFFMGLSIAFGFLAKGMLIFLFPIIAVVFMLLKKEFKEIFNKWLVIGVVASVAITIVWIFVGIKLNGTNFFAAFQFNQTGKFSTSPQFWRNFSLDFIYFLKSGLKIWFLFFIPSLLFALYKWKRHPKILLVVFFSVYFLVLLFAENKSNWFLIPLYPIIALIIAGSIIQFFSKFKKNAAVKVCIVGVLFIAFIQTKMYKNEYIVPDIAVDEARVALYAKNVTQKDEPIYLTNYYVPTTVYYSERKVLAVYSEHEKNAWWIKPKTEWSTILNNHNVTIITTEQEFKELQENYPKYKMKILFKSGDKLLVKKV